MFVQEGLRNGLKIKIYDDSDRNNDYFKVSIKYDRERLINGELIESITLYVRMNNRSHQHYDRIYFRYNNMINSVNMDLVGCNLKDYMYNNGTLKVYLKLDKATICERIRDVFL